PAYMARVDHTFNQNNSVFARYLYSKYNTLQGDPLNGRPQVFPGFPPQGEVFRTTSNLALSYRRVFSPRIINELTAGYARFVFLFTQGEANPAFPDVPPFDFRGITEPYINTPRTFRAITSPQVLDNLSIVRGAHVFRTGLNFRFYRHVDQRGQPGGINVTPAITFNSSDRAVTFASTAGTSGTTGLPILVTPPGINSTDRTRLLNTVNNLLGIPAIISQTFISNLSQDVFLPFKVGNKVSLFGEKHIVDQYNFYIQDEWRMRPNLTVNYGARWEINLAPSTSGGNVYVASTPIAGTPGPANPVINAPGAVAFVKANKWYNRNNLGAIGPRIGLAYSPEWKTGFLHRVFGENGKSVIRLGYGIAFDPISSFQVTAAAGRVPGLVTTCSLTVGGTPTKGCANAPNVRLGAGFPVELTAPTVNPSSFLTPPLLLKNVAPPITVFAPDMKMPTVHEWNLSFQRELPGGFVAQAAYIGRRGLRLFMAYNINQINADPLIPSFLLLRQNVRNGCNPNGVGALDATVAPCVNPIPASQIPLLAANTPGITGTFVNSSTVVDQLRTNAAGAFAERIENTTLALKLRPNQQFDLITYLDNSGSSTYHAAQFTLRRRFASGLGLSLAYTFGKSIDNQSVDPVGAASGGGLSTTNSRTPIDNRDWRIERARSDFDRTQVLTVASVWELPVGKGKRFLNGNNRFVNQFFGGWSINGIYTYMSGEPFSVRSGSRTSNSAHESRAVVLTPIKARLQNIPNVIGPVVFPDNKAFAIPEPGQNGSGRNIFVAPSYWNLDLGFIKIFPITERFKLQFRSELFNALNHPNFDNPRDASAGSPSIQSDIFARTCCAAVAPPSSQTIIQTGESARIIQFALKLQF
ncbi:MAG: TonB-dependent receptor, partial [Acidobacteriota bacterium]|nr:TonB-dependent receptor [Acidobacteriota bacterium]